MILVLGASSYIGKRIFAAIGSVRAIGTHNTHSVPGSVFFDATRMRVLDILPPKSEITHAIICYAETAIDACKADLQRSYQINVNSAKQVIDDLVQQGIKPVFMSSEYVFDGTRGNYVEEDDPNPITVYGGQKLEIENYLADRSGEYTVLRLAKVFGTEPGDGTILSDWLIQIDNGDEIKCARDQVFSPVHVEDVVAAIKAAVELDLSGTYHVASTQPYSRLEMLRTLIDFLGLGARVTECSIRDFDFLDNRPLDLSMNPAKLLQAAKLDVRTVTSCCRELADRLTLARGSR